MTKKFKVSIAQNGDKQEHYAVEAESLEEAIESLYGSPAQWESGYRGIGWSLNCDLYTITVERVAEFPFDVGPRKKDIEDRIKRAEDELKLARKDLKNL